jgi:hypothetical protein
VLVVHWTAQIQRGIGRGLFMMTMQARNRQQEN